MPSRVSCVSMALAVLLLSALAYSLRALPPSLLLVFCGSVAALMLLGGLW
jgi:hypothetical protein